MPKSVLLSVAITAGLGLVALINAVIGLSGNAPIAKILIPAAVALAALPCAAGLLRGRASSRGGFLLMIHLGYLLVGLALYLDHREDGLDRGEIVTALALVAVILTLQVSLSTRGARRYFGVG